MLINADLPTENLALSLQQKRPEAGTATSQTSSTAGNGSTASQLDASLQRLTDVPAGVQDADWEIQDEQGAGQAVDFARQAMLKQPGTTLAAQANQLSQNVLSLLQPAD
jgi:flagellin-like hook-associated protein FlgL